MYIVWVWQEYERMQRTEFIMFNWVETRRMSENHSENAIFHVMYLLLLSSRTERRKHENLLWKI